MKQLFFKWCFMLGLTIFICSNLKAADLKEYQLIRRAFLEVLNLPPTPSELEWYLTYNDKSYEVAVEWLVAQHKIHRFIKLNDADLAVYLNSALFKTKPFTNIDPLVLQQIINYQCGAGTDAPEIADKKMIEISIAYGENNTMDVFDYMSLCLTARVTNVDEANRYLELFKQYSDREEGYLAVLNEMKQLDSFAKK